MVTKDDEKRIEELIEILSSAAKSYYDEDKEIMTNLEYDALYDELERLEKKTGIVSDKSLTQRVGFGTSFNLPKVKHKTKMLSLDKTKSIDELIAWLGDKAGTLSWKLDGLTVVLTYSNGRLKRAVTRGNGEVGEIITDNAKEFKNIPKEIKEKSEVVIRGEAVIKYSDFEKINNRLDVDAKYKNPRNLVSGSTRQLDSKVTKERCVNFFAFAMGESNINFKNSRKNQFAWLKEQGFEIVPFVPVTKENLEKNIKLYEHEIKNFDIPSDGLVLSYDDLDYGKSLGVTAKFPRDQKAFKWQDEEKETILREIIWSPSRTGLLNPIARFDPVWLEGTTVKRASVHNLNIMRDLELGIGDKIKVYKANMIIPQISANETRSGNIEVPKKCPVCGGVTVEKNETGTSVLMCENPNCIAKKIKRFSLFVSKEALDIEGLSEATLLKFIGMKYISNLADIFKLERYKKEIIDMEGFGEKSYNNLIKSINQARHTSPEKMLVGLGISGIGVATAKLISDYAKASWREIANLTKAELMEIDGVGDVIAGDYETFFKSEQNIKEINDILKEIIINEEFEEKEETLNGMTFVITGNLNHYENRTELKKEIERKGGKVAGSVSGKTSFLITNDKDSNSEKSKKAKELNIPIIDENQIINMLKN